MCKGSGFYSISERSSQAIYLMRDGRGSVSFLMGKTQPIIHMRFTKNITNSFAGLSRRKIMLEILLSKLGKPTF